jgi:ATP synthase protein I
MMWASRVTTVGLEFALPALLGVWLDRYWSLAPLGVIGGAVLGFIGGMAHLLQMSREGSNSDRKRPGSR